MPFVALAVVERRLLHIGLNSSIEFVATVCGGVSEEVEDDDDDEEADDDDVGCGVNGKLDAVCGCCSFRSVVLVAALDARRSICFLVKLLLLIFVLEKS